MKTITKTLFIAMLDEGTLEWPPFVLGSHIYSRRPYVGDREVYRAEVEV